MPSQTLSRNNLLHPISLQIICPEKRKMISTEYIQTGEKDPQIIIHEAQSTRRSLKGMLKRGSKSHLILGAQCQPGNRPRPLPLPALGRYLTSLSGNHSPNSTPSSTWTTGLLSLHPLTPMAVERLGKRGLVGKRSERV